VLRTLYKDDCPDNTKKTVIQDKTLTNGEKSKE
jgi:hypothetical protein